MSEAGVGRKQPGYCGESYLPPKQDMGSNRRAPGGGEKSIQKKEKKGKSQGNRKGRPACWEEKTGQLKGANAKNSNPLRKNISPGSPSLGGGEHKRLRS